MLVACDCGRREAAPSDWRTVQPVNEFVVFGLLLVLALSFDFLNGFHDSANVVATMIASRALSPRLALGLAAIANFIGPLIFGTAVAKTVGEGLIQSESVTITVVLAALLSASLWNIITWWFGIPSSSSHALVGGLVGGAIAYGGLAMVIWDGVLLVFAALFLSPVLGFVFGWILLRLTLFLVRGATPKVNITFNRLQLFTATALALSHGTNDAQPRLWGWRCRTHEQGTLDESDQYRHGLACHHSSDGRACRHFLLHPQDIFWSLILSFTPTSNYLGA